MVVAAPSSAVAAPSGVVTVDGAVALSALVSLCENHLRTAADTMWSIAGTPSVESGDWSQMERPLEQVRTVGVPGTLWFATPDGTYWLAGSGKQSQKIDDRPYWKRLMKGQPVIGALVLSRSTDKPVAIVAVPVRSGGKITGVLGTSVDLAALSRLLTSEMHLPSKYFFFAIDQTGRIAVHNDVSNVFVHPATLSPALEKVEREFLSHAQGEQTYVYRGVTRTVIYERSELTGWTYGFGVEQ